MEQKMLTPFDSLDPNQYWKFFIDCKYWNEGEYKFDNEDSPGYLQHANHALAWMLKTYNEKRPVDLDYIITLRNIAFHESPETSRGLALSSVGSGINTDSFTEAGLEQLLTECAQSNTPKFKINILDAQEKKATTNIQLIDSFNNPTAILETIKNAIERGEDIFLQRDMSTSDDENDAVIDAVNVASFYLNRYQEGIQHAKKQ